MKSFHEVRTCDGTTYLVRRIEKSLCMANDHVWYWKSVYGDEICVACHPPGDKKVLDPESIF
jgi:hypothetical protein